MEPVDSGRLPEEDPHERGGRGGGGGGGREERLVSSSFTVERWPEGVVAIELGELVPPANNDPLWGSAKNIGFGAATCWGALERRWGSVATVA